MPKAYGIVNVSVHDPARYPEYPRLLPSELGGLFDPVESLQ
jgi:uncharacterized protein (DUF1330 family)